MDQLTKFNRALQELAPAALAGVGGAASAAAASRAASRRGIDGIVLTKFDTIDDKVGACKALLMLTRKVAKWSMSCAAVCVLGGPPGFTTLS